MYIYLYYSTHLVKSLRGANIGSRMSTYATVYEYHIFKADTEFCVLK